MEDRRKLSIFQVNLFYLFLAIAFINIGPKVQGIDLYMGLLFTEYIIILLPSLLLIKSNKLSIKKTLRLNKISLKQILLVIIITVFTYPLAVFAQGIFLTILDAFAEFAPNVLPVSTDPKGLLYGLFVMSITPGICEEIMFRGVILNAYDKLGYKKGILITALLFGIFHFNLVNFIGPLILGIVFGIMVYRTNSLYSSIIGHTLNNAIAVGILYFVNKYADLFDEVLEQEPSVVANSSVLIPTIIGLLFLFLCYKIVRKSLNSLGEIPKLTEEIEAAAIKEDRKVNKALKYLPIGIVLIMFFYMNFKYMITIG